MREHRAVEGFVAAQPLLEVREFATGFHLRQAMGDAPAGHLAQLQLQGIDLGAARRPGQGPDRNAAGAFAGLARFGAEILRRLESYIK